MDKPQKETIKKIDHKLERVSLAETRDMIYEKFRTNIRILRAKEGWSGCEAGERIGLKNGRRIIDLEYGRGIPTMEEMMLFSKAFCCTIDELLYKQANIIFN